MPRKILVFFMSMVLLGGYGIGIYRAQADSDLDQFPVYILQGTVFVDNVPLTPTTNSEHTQYVLLPLVKLSTGTTWTELTARKYQMGSDVDAGDDFLLLIQDDDEVDGVPIQQGTNFEMKILIYLLGDEATKYDTVITPPPGEPWYVGKGTSPGGIFAQADVYSSIPPGQPQNLQAAATVGSEIRNINLQWTAPGSDDGLGTVTGYLAKVSTAPITSEPEWNAATLLNTLWLTPPLAGPGQPESRTATVDSPAPALDPNGTYYVALRAVDAAGTQGPFISAQVNMPPKATNVSISPASPKTTDNLVLTYTYSDPEGDPESGTLIKWYKGGVHQPAHNNQNPLPSSATTKGETWKASVQPANAKGMGLEVESNTLTILNTPPVANPNGPYSTKIDSGETTVLPIIFNGAGSSDADGDPLTYAWAFGDGTTGTGPTPSHTYPAIPGLYPNTFSVTLTVNDGEANSPTVNTTAAVTINQKPVADAGGPYEGIAGEPLTFDGSGSSDPDSDPLTYAWDFGDGKTGTGVNPQNIYDSYGSYTATLVVSDPLEDSAPDTASVLVRARPVADFTWDPTTPDEGSQVDFTDASTDADGTIVLWIWDFGDGFGDVGPNVSHTYTDNGIYTVTLTVTDNDGLTDTEQHSVTVNNVAPDVEAGADQSVNEGDTVSISGTFTDPGSSDTHIAAINWGDGTAVDTIDPAASPVNASHVYADNGVFTVTLTVTDDDGGVGTDTLTVTVSNVAPTAEAGADQSVNEGATVSISGIFTDPGSSDTHTATIDWGDGTAVDTVDPATSPVPGSHVYADDDVYTVTLTVTDDDGGIGTDTLTVTVSNVAPVVDAGADQAVNEGDTVSISGIFTDPGSGDTHIATIDWGDGTAVDTVDPATSPVPGSHVYVDEGLSGVYTVTLTVTDDDGGVGTDTLVVTVSNAPPVVDAGADQAADEADTVSISGTFTDAGSLDTHTATIDWGDGTAVDTVDPATSPVPGSHVYADDDDYTVTLTVTDNDGGVGTDTLVVTVSNVAPVVDAGADQSANEGDVVSISGTFTDVSAVDTHTATIDWGDGTAVDIVDPAVSPVPGSHVYADDDDYTVTLTVTDDDGGQGSDTLEVTVSNVAPVVEAGPDQSVNEGDVVSISGTFTDPGSGDTHIAAINWGDGTAVDTVDPATSPVPGSHVYADNGVYTVTLTVTDDDGGQGSDTLTVTVSNVAPVVDAGADQSVNEGDTVSISGIFTDPGSGDTHTATIDWGDGTAVDIVDPAVSPVPGSHVYADDDDYTVTLTVTDDDGGVGSDTLEVTVSNVAPVVDAGVDQAANEGATVSISGTFTDPGSGDTHIATINWGDGTAVDTVDPATSPVPGSHVYVDEGLSGVYTVTLTVTDDDGGVGTDTLIVTVSNAPPVVDAGADQSVNEGDTVSISGSFTDASSVDTHTATIDWGDNTPVDTVDPAVSPVLGSHAYADNGVYTVTLTVTDNDGGVGTDTLTVTVSNVAPVVDAGPGDLEVPVKQPVNITVEFSDMGTADTHTATINWKDGTIEPGVVSEVNGSGTVTGSHMYVVAGEFDVVVTITDDDGGMVTHSMKITVKGIKVLAVTFNVLDPTLIVELDEPVEPAANFDLIGMEVNDSGKWDYQMSQERGLRIEETSSSTILHIDMKRDWINSSQLIRQALEWFFPVDFLAWMGAFRDAAGSENLEVTGVDDMRITMVADGLILGNLGDVSGNGEFTSYDVALVAKAIVGGLKQLPIKRVTPDVELLLPGKSFDIAKNTADINRDNMLNASDLLTGLSLVSGRKVLAPPDIASDTKKCRLNVNNYDNGKLDVSIDVEDVSGVYCADIVIGYDPGTLTVADVSKTSSISGWVFADAAESGKLRISMAGLSQPTANGSLVNVSIDAASADAIKELQIVELELNGGRARAEVENLPKAFALMPNYPNPFNPETWIPYQLTVPANVTVSIYNLNGQIVRRLELGTRMPGSYISRSRAAYWDGRNESGEMVSSGIYFYQLQAGRDAAVRKMVIVK